MRIHSGKKEKMLINVHIKDIHHGAVTENLQIVQMLKKKYLSKFI